MNPPHKDRPPDGDEPFTPEERAMLRQLLQQAPQLQHIVQEEAHASWLRGRIKVIYPWVIALAAAAVAVIDWVQKHIRWNGP